MSKILLATDSYHFSPTANGICVEEIADELIKMGNEVHVLCFRHGDESVKDEINGINIHRIRMDGVNTLRFLYEKELTGWKQNIVKKMMVILNRVEAVAFIHWFPMRSPIFCVRYKNMVERLQKEYGYDMIIASYSPFEAAYSLAKIKAEPSVKKCLYTLDSFTNLRKRFFLSREYQERKGWVWEQKIYDKCDLILNLKCHEKHYSNSRYDKYRKKIQIVDIPHMISYQQKNEENHSTGKLGILHITYAGAIRDDIMPWVLRYFEGFMENKELVFDLYTRSSVNEYKNLISKKAYESVVMHGFLEREAVLQRELDSDLLLSMGNRDSDFISSKIFELIATGKKIVHIYSYEKDSALPYYNWYPNCCILNINDPVEINTSKLRKFFSEPIKEIRFEEIEKIYYMNTPGYTARIIVNELQHRRKNE